MDTLTTTYAVTAIVALCGTITSMVIYMYKKLQERVQRLERVTQHRDDIRQTIDDKVTPIQERIDAIDHKLDKILDIMLNR